MIHIICHSTGSHHVYRIRNAIIEKLLPIKDKCIVSKFQILIGNKLLINFYSGDYHHKILGHHPEYHYTYNAVVNYVLSIEGSKRILYDELMKIIDDVVKDEFEKTEKIFYDNSEGGTE